MGRIVRIMEIHGGLLGFDMRRGLQASSRILRRGSVGGHVRRLSAGTGFIVDSTLDTLGWQMTVDRRMTESLTAVTLGETMLRFN